MTNLLPCSQVGPTFTSWAKTANMGPLVGAMRCSLGKPVDAFSVLRAAGTLSPAQRADIITALTPTPAVIPTIGNSSVHLLERYSAR